MHLHICAVVALVNPTATPELPHPYFHPIKWLITLTGTIIAAAIAVVFDNIVKRLRDTRGHNLFQLVHEVLAEHQLAYPLYFVALLTGAEFLPNYWWAKELIGVLTLLAFGFYLIAVYLTTLHEDHFRRDHQCHGRGCHETLTAKAFIKLYWQTSIFALLMLGSSIFLAFVTT
jgi:hypothetical protein